jgi:hypothetical protein
MRPYLIFIFPMLRQLRIITKKFQLKKGDNLEIFVSLQDFFMGLARRILQPTAIRENNAEQLCRLNLTTQFNFLSKEHTDYGMAFLNEIENFEESIKSEMMDRARTWMHVLFTGLQARLVGTFKLVAKIEKFSLPNFFRNPPTIQDYRRPFFKMDALSWAVLEDEQRNLIAKFETRFIFFSLLMISL